MISTLRAVLSMGMCGHSFWSHEIGGFYGKLTPDLYIRWGQFGLLSPLSRAHGLSTRFPWDFGEEALHIFRKYVQLRYKLMPYIYTYACIASQTSLPIIRAMILEFTGDPNTWTMGLQYMFGSEIMVAPIYNSEGRRPVYFPTGRWVDYWTLEVIEGPQSRFIECPLEILPMYIKSNAMIPVTESPDFLTDIPFSLVIFDSYLFENGGFILRDVNGVTNVSVLIDDSNLIIQIEGEKQLLGFRFFPLSFVPPIKKVVVNESEVDWVRFLELQPSSETGWTRAKDGTVNVMVHLN